MEHRLSLLLGLLLASGILLVSHAAHAAPRGVTVYLERDGRSIDQRDREIRIPRFGGGDRAWNAIRACVAERFSPFNVDVVDRKPARGAYITAVIGGRASQLGLDDRWTNGVGPYSANRVIANATVHVFSKVGTGERDVANLCAVTVHEVSHALGLDHTYKCGDIMSYFLDRCGPRRFLDVEMPCGEDGPRRCGDGKRMQNSYRKLAQMVGLRSGKRPPAEPVEPDDGRYTVDEPYDDFEDDAVEEPWREPADDGDAEPAEPESLDTLDLPEGVEIPRDARCTRRGDVIECRWTRLRRVR